MFVGQIMKKILLAIAAILALMFVYAYGYAIGKLSVSDRGRFVFLPASDNAHLADAHELPLSF